MLRLKLNHVSKRGHRSEKRHQTCNHFSEVVVMTTFGATRQNWCHNNSWITSGAASWQLSGSNQHTCASVVDLGVFRLVRAWVAPEEVDAGLERTPLASVAEISRDATCINSLQQTAGLGRAVIIADLGIRAAELGGLHRNALSGITLQSHVVKLTRRLRLHGHCVAKQTK